MENKELFEQLVSSVIGLGATRAAVISADAVETDAAFRGMCESNACGMYGKCWTCPPECGAIDELMGKIRTYDHVLVYQTVGELEDSYDFEGMIEVGNRHNVIAQKLRGEIRRIGVNEPLHLGAGGCRVCPVCAKRTDEPCRYPELALPSLEAHGINVSRLAAAAGMKYINGQDTVTYFGAVFFRD